MALVGAGGKPQIWIRPLDSLTAQPLAGTEGAAYPFWSPDGRSIGFFADGKLEKIESGGGAVQTICAAPGGRGASWSRDGVIVFAGSALGSLSKVSAAGGTPVAVGPKASANERHRLPWFLPDGRHLLFYSMSWKTFTDSSVSVLDLETGAVKELFKSESGAMYVPPGYLVFVRQGDLVAQRFDAGKLATTGEAVPIAEGVNYYLGRFTGNFAFAGPRLLLYESEGRVSEGQLTWLDRDGKKLGTVGDPAKYEGVAISPDGRRAVVMLPGTDGKAHLWMMDLQSGVRTRFTLAETGTELPIWSPDGRLVAYTEMDAGPSWRIVVKDSSGAAAPTVLFERRNTFLGGDCWSSDGRTILVGAQSPETQALDVWGIDTVDPAHKVRPIITGPANQVPLASSPDGKWLAYASAESGRWEIYVTTYPGLRGKWQITSTGADVGGGWLGPTQFFYSVGGRLRTVTLTSRGSGLEVGAPVSILGGEEIQGPSDFDRTSKRFLEAIPLGPQTPPTVHVVTNWAAALKAE
jgi:Tol biopolymer transport system component